MSERRLRSLWYIHDFIGLEGESIQERCKNAVEMARRNITTEGASDSNGC